MKTFTNIICWVSVAVGLAACTDEDYPVYDAGQKSSVFFEYLNEKEETVNAMEYAFNFDIANEHTVEVPIKLMGMLSGQDRTIELRPVKEKSTMVAGTHYTLEPVVLPANAVETSAKVVLLRDKDPELLNKSFALTLEIADNADLSPVGGKQQFTITYTDKRPECPEWWLSPSTQEYPWSSPFPEYKFEGVQGFFDVFYELGPKLNQDTYNKMIDEYGHYFVKAKAQMGPYAMYRTFVIRILMELYDRQIEGLEWPNGKPKIF